MNYFEVLIASSRFRRDEPLTYCSEDKISPGTLVQIPLGNRQALGIVVKSITKPEFEVKSISRDLGHKLPGAIIKLANWMTEYYASSIGQIYSLMIPPDLASIPRQVPEVSGNQHLETLAELNPEQAEIIEQISLKSSGSTVIHGDTGTGKTRIYIELARRAILDKRNVLVLIPEIGLTTQLRRDFEQSFQGRVLVTHSGLTNAQRRNLWLKIMNASEPLVIIGPRSALFAPLDKVGLIVVDEAHESAYKQENAPYYDARRVAAKLANIHGARLVYGTATPSVSEYYLAEQVGAPILRLERLAASDKSIKSSVEIVNLREKSDFSRNPQLSDKLLDGISQALHNREQSLVFLNRRGTAKLILCQNCGWQALCPNCDIPLTYHGDHHQIRCHTCGYQCTAPSTCPECRGVDIIYRNLGTKSIVEALSKIFPTAKIQRFDTDSTKKERLENNYQAVSRGEVDILVGTQMLAKGLDLPKLGFVGIVSADTALGFPDYTASERTYQMLAQVLGRIGRGHRAGRAVIQTHQPGSPALNAAIAKDWQTFYASELKERRTYNFPPFCYLLKLTCSRKTINGAVRAANNLATELRTKFPNVEIIGPSPSFYEKFHGSYRWQIVVKAKKRSSLTDIMRALPSNWTADPDPSDLL